MHCGDRGRGVEFRLLGGEGARGCLTLILASTCFETGLLRGYSNVKDVRNITLSLPNKYKAKGGGGQTSSLSDHFSGKIERVAFLS